MRWVFLLVVIACGGTQKRWEDPNQAKVEDIAVWFTKAALAGDESRAHSLSLWYNELPAIRARDQAWWDTEIKAATDELAKLGGGEDYHHVSAKVVENKDNIATLEVTIDRGETRRLVFAKSNGTWKFSPHAPGPLPVEDTAVMFMRAALSGDRSTAMALTLTFEEVAQVSRRATADEWNAEIKDLLDQLAKEGAENGSFQITSASVEQRRTLEPDEKVKKPVEIAVVKITIKDGDTERANPLKWLFIKTDGGHWKLSPKN